MDTLTPSEVRPAPRPLSAMVLMGLLAGPFMTMIDGSIVNVALPDISAALHSPLATVQWVGSAYLLALGVALASTAYLAKRFGTRRVYIVSLLGFTVASGLCALAPGIEALIGARVLQGVFGAPLVPLALNMLLGRSGQGSMNTKQIPAAAGMVLFLAPALGPSLGGLLIHLSGWPLIFLVNAPIGAVAILSALRIPQSLTQNADHTVHFDVLGLVMLAAGLALTIYGASQGPEHGWLSFASWPYWLIGLVLLIVYTMWALRHEHPIVDVELLRRPQPALALGLSALVSVVLFAMALLIPIFIQELQGESAMAAGLVLLPQGLITGLGTVLGNSLTSRLGMRLTVVLGMVVLTVGTVALLLVSVVTPLWLIALILCGRGFAIGLVIQPLLMALIGSLPQAKVPDGNTFFNVAQRIGGTLGISLLLTFFQVRESFHVREALATLGMTGQLAQGAALAQANLPAAAQAKLAQAATAGFHDIIWLLTVLSALGLGMALLLRDRAGAQDDRPDAVV